MKNVNEAVRDIFSALIAIIISFAVYKVLGQLVKDNLSNLYVANFAGQLIFAIPVFFAVILLKKTGIYRSFILKTILFLKLYSRLILT